MMIRNPRRVVVLGGLVSLVAGLGLGAPGLTAGAATGPTFTNFSLAGLAPNGGGAVGTTCPGSPKCYNNAAEPAIRADEAGNFYASSEDGLGAGTQAWKSTDGGRHYATLPSPNAGSSTNTTGLAPGGGDTDLAVGDDKNSQGSYSVFVASLSLANIDVSPSYNGGKSFGLNPASATIPGDDREWIAADDAHQNPLGLPIEGGNKVCLSYHDVATSNIDVNCSYDGAKTFTQLGDAIDTAHAYLIDNNMIGNLAIARDTVEGDATHGNHNIYQVFSGIANAGETVCSTQGTCGFHAVWIGVSKDGGQTFTNHPVYINPNTKVSYGHQFVNISVDRAGNLYVLYSDDHNLFYSYSTTQGSSWSTPVRVNKTPSNTAIEPWSVAGRNGKLDVVWYGTSYYKAGTKPDNYPATAQWHAYLAQNLTATTPGSSFTQVAATPVNHTGGVCESGVGCTGNRDLFDDFGVAASPRTGLASIVYSDDQYHAGQPNSPGCTPATTNTSSCDHTAIATQLNGPGLS